MKLLKNFDIIIYGVLYPKIRYKKGRRAFFQINNRFDLVRSFIVVNKIY